jgi:excisionase family DNA binding protein
MKLQDRDLLETLMREHGMSATDLAETAGCSRQAIGQLIKNPARGCRHTLAEAITWALGVPLGELFTYAPGEEAPPSFLTTAQVAVMLGITPDHVRKLRRAGELAGANMGASGHAAEWRFDRAEVDRFIAARSVAA